MLWEDIGNLLSSGEVDIEYLCANSGGEDDYVPDIPGPSERSESADSEPVDF
jgi:hypothetical protein